LEVEATSRDLSSSGVFVCTQLLDPIGTRCELTILIDGGPPLQLGGVVRRVVEHDPLGAEPVGMGVEFDQVGAEARAWLEKTVAKIAATG
ncbi:MAG: PilZ domain-containing protein, partial [Acidobacteriota bacterium]